MTAKRNSNHRRELAHRASDGVEVTLHWSPGNRVTIEIFDTRRDERLEFEVGRADALDAFYHPYAYATRRHHKPPFPIRSPVRV
jgi:hypothetical protein